MQSQFRSDDEDPLILIIEDFRTAAALGIDTDDADGRVDALQPLALCFWAAGGGAPLLGQLRGAV